MGQTDRRRVSAWSTLDVVRHPLCLALVYHQSCTVPRCRDTRARANTVDRHGARHAFCRALVAHQCCTVSRCQRNTRGSADNWGWLPERCLFLDLFPTACADRCLRQFLVDSWLFVACIGVLNATERDRRDAEARQVFILGSSLWTDSAGSSN